MARINNIDIHVDYSDLRSRLRGLTTDRLSADPDVRRLLVHCGMIAKQSILPAVQSGVPNDPREAWRALRMIRWSHSDGKMGTAVTILSGKSTGKPKSGKNRMNQYQGAERGFILNWMNAGTVRRKIGGRMARTGRGKSRKTIAAKKGEPGYRGRIKARRFFQSAADPAIRNAANAFVDGLQELISKKFNVS